MVLFVVACAAAPPSGESRQPNAAVAIAPSPSSEVGEAPKVLLPPERVVCPASPTPSPWAFLAYRDCPIHPPMTSWGGACREPFCMRPCAMTRSNDGHSVITRFEYDRRGRVIVERTDDYEVLHEWDRDGRLLRSAIGHDVAYEYRNGRFAKESSAGRSVDVEYDARGRVVRQLTDEGSSRVEVRFEYDAAGRIAEERVHVRRELVLETSYPVERRQIDIRSIHHYVYDAGGRLIGVESSRVDGDGKSRQSRETRKYDRVGRIVEIRGETSTRFRYDTLGRLIEEVGDDAVTRYDYEC